VSQVNSASRLYSLAAGNVPSGLNVQQPDWLVTVTYAVPTTCVVAFNGRFVGQSWLLNAPAFWLFGGNTGAGQLPETTKGALVIEYGNGSQVTRRVMDAKTGNYQVPPSTQVRAGLVIYDTTGGATFLNVQANLTISPGTINTSTRPTWTQGQSLAGAGAAYSPYIPPGTRWVDCWAEIAGLSATAPILTLNGTSGIVQRSYVAGAFVPSWGPVEWSSYDYGASSPRLVNSGVDTANAWLRCWLEM